jgi:hypothetical protein
MPGNEQSVYATTHRVGAEISRGRDASQRRNSSTRAGASSRENLHVWISPHWELLAPVAKLNRHVGQRTSRSSGSCGQKYRPQGASPSPASKFQSHSLHGTNASAPSIGLTLPGRPRTVSSCITHLASRFDDTSETTIGLEPKVPTASGPSSRLPGSTARRGTGVLSRDTRHTHAALGRAHRPTRTSG